MPKGYATGGRDELSRLLVTIRGDRTQDEVRQAAAAYLDGRVLSQSKIYRAEAGRFPLPPEEADAYARACRASAADRRKLAQLSKAAHRDRSKPALQRNPVKIQERILGLEQQATLIRSWQPDIVIGTLQTPSYTSAISGRTVPDWQDLRDRRRALMREPGREWRLLMHEKALSWGVTSAQVMIEQIDHIMELSWSPQIRLGLVPGEPVVRDGPPPAGAFHIYDAAVAIAANDAGTSFLSSEPLVTAYVSMFVDLEPAAVYDDAARNLMAQIKKAWTETARG